MAEPSFVYVTYIATTPERLWAALTDAAFTREYWGGRAVESDWQVGSEVRFRKRDGEHDAVRGKVLEAEPPWRLAMSWAHEEEPGQGPRPATRVSYRLERAGPENVRLTVVHEPFHPGSEVDDGLRAGWPAILSSLKTLLETGTGLDVTRRWAEAGN